MKNMKYIDSNVFIYYVTLPESDPKAKASKEILIKIAEGNMHAATSALTWDELTWVVRKKLGKKTSFVEGRKFLEFPNLRLIAINEAVVNQARKIAEKSELDPRDAIHAACCIENAIDEIVSDDGDFDAVTGIRRIAL